MEKAELIARLKALERSDPELLLDFIHDEEIAAAWMAIEKWYA